MPSPDEEDLQAELEDMLERVKEIKRRMREAKHAERLSAEERARRRWGQLGVAIVGLATVGTLLRENWKVTVAAMAGLMALVMAGIVAETPESNRPQIAAPDPDYERIRPSIPDEPIRSGRSEQTPVPDATDEPKVAEEEPPFRAAQAADGDANEDPPTTRDERPRESPQPREPRRGDGSEPPSGPPNEDEPRDPPDGDEPPEREPSCSVAYVAAEVPSSPIGPIESETCLGAER